jgi:hypothetical protein
MQYQPTQLKKRAERVVEGGKTEGDFVRQALESNVFGIVEGYRFVPAGVDTRRTNTSK